MGVVIIITLAWSNSTVIAVKELRPGPKQACHVKAFFPKGFHFTCFPLPSDSHIAFPVISCAARNHQVTFGEEGEYQPGNGIGRGKNFDLGKPGQVQMKRCVLTFAVEKTLDLESENKAECCLEHLPAGGALRKHPKPQFPHGDIMPACCVSLFCWGDI